MACGQTDEGHRRVCFVFTLMLLGCLLLLVITSKRQRQGKQNE